MEKWEFTIGIGLQTLLFLAGGYGMVLRNDWSNKAMTVNISDIRQEMKKLADVVIIQAVQTTRIDNLASQLLMIQNRMDDFSHGRGFISTNKHN